MNEKDIWLLRKSTSSVPERMAVCGTNAIWSKISAGRGRSGDIVPCHAVDLLKIISVCTFQDCDVLIYALVMLLSISFILIKVYLIPFC